MPKFTLTCEHTDEFTGEVYSKVTHQFTEEYLPEVTMYMDMFLKGCGYSYDGALDIVDYNETIVKTTELGEEALAGYSNHYFDTERNK